MNKKRLFDILLKEFNSAQISRIPQIIVDGTVLDNTA